jgi:hypothetical protein
MKTFLAIAVSLALLPAMASAAPLVPVVGSGGAGWHLMPTPPNPADLADPHNAPNINRTQDHWAGLSYDRAHGGSTACGAGALIMGFACSWNLGGGAGDFPPVGPATPGVPLYYWGFDPGTGADPNHNADPNFYFSGTLDLDLEVLMNLTSWVPNVEFGWYVAGDPTSTTTLLGGPPAFDSVVGGTSSVTLSGDFGFYYKNYDRGTAFFTESHLNFIFSGSLAKYLSGFGPDDEMNPFSLDPNGFQQWALFAQGDKFWLGLEDIYGKTAGAGCTPGIGPCSDYDFNDFIIGGQIRQEQVPEPATLTMLALGLFGAAVMLRRRGAND